MKDFLVGVGIGFAIGAIMCKTCKPVSDMAQKVRVTNQYYDTKKISKDFANGVELTISGFGSGKIFFSNYEKRINLELDSDMIHKDYLLEREEDAYRILEHGPESYETLSFWEGK